MHIARFNYRTIVESVAKAPIASVAIVQWLARKLEIRSCHSSAWRSGATIPRG
jgi:hypothetical protein